MVETANSGIVKPLDRTESTVPGRVGTMSVETFCKEADVQADHVEADAVKLNRLHINPLERAKEIRQAAANLREKEILWDRERVTNSNDLDLWLNLKPLSYTTRDEWVDFLGFVAEEENDAKGAAIIEEIAENSGDADMVLDVGKIASYMESKPELYSKYEIAPQEAQKVRELYNNLTRLIGASTADRQRPSALKDSRDAAYAQLETLIRRVRRAGKIVFKGDASGLKRYRSEYMHQATQKLKTNKAEKAADVSL